jgi:hypothetical protein
MHENVIPLPDDDGDNEIAVTTGIHGDPPDLVQEFPRISQ